MDYFKSKSWGRDSERARAASRVTAHLRTAEIDGVLIDFRHPDIDPHEWEPRPWWHLTSLSQGSARLCFPSDTALRIPQNDWSFMLNEGDRVFLKSWAFVENGAKFLHPHDQKIIEAKLVCERAGQSPFDLPTPLRLYGTLAMRELLTWEAFERMEIRAAKSIGQEDLYDGPSSHVHAKRQGTAHESAFWLRQARAKYREGLRLLAGSDEEIRDAISDHWFDDIFQELINAAALGGYLLACSESKNLEDAKAQQEKILADGRLKNKDYDNRRVRALEIWETKPTASINYVAQTIAQEMGRDKASVMASLWEVVPPSSASYQKALQKQRG